MEKGKGLIKIFDGSFKRKCNHTSVVYPFGTIQRVELGSETCRNCPCFDGLTDEYGDRMPASFASYVSCKYESMSKK